MDRHVVDAFDHDRIASTRMDLLRIFLHLPQNVLVRYILPVVRVIQLLELIDNLAFLDAAVADRCEHRLPVAEAVLTEHLVLVSILLQLRLI